jgi:hypothetical protein
MSWVMWTVKFESWKGVCYKPSCLLGLWGSYLLLFIDDDVHGVRLRLWTVVTNRPIVHPPGNIWAWRTMVEWYQWGKTPDLSTRAFWQYYQQSSSSKAGGLVKEMMNFPLWIISFILRGVLSHAVKSYQLYFPSKRRCATDFYHPWSGLNPRTLGPVASTLTTRPPRMTRDCLFTIHYFCFKERLQACSFFSRAFLSLWIGSVSSSSWMLIQLSTCAMWIYFVLYSIHLYVILSIIPEPIQIDTSLDTSYKSHYSILHPDFPSVCPKQSSTDPWTSELLHTSI